MPPLPYLSTTALQRELDERYEARLPPRRYSSTPSRPSATPATPARELIRSSPVEGDLVDYIEWLKRRKPLYLDDLDDALNKLLDGGFSTELIQDWKGHDDENWKTLHIKPGIGAQIARYISQWGRERQGIIPSARVSIALPTRTSPRRLRVSSRHPVGASKPPRNRSPIRPSVPYKSGTVLTSVERESGEAFEHEIDLGYARQHDYDLDGETQVDDSQKSQY